MKVYLVSILLLSFYTIGNCQLSNPIPMHESVGLILESRYIHINGDDEIDAVYLLSNKNNGGALYQAIGERVNGNLTFITSIVTDKKYNKTVSINIIHIKHSYGTSVSKFCKY